MKVICLFLGLFLSGISLAQEDALSLYTSALQKSEKEVEQLKQHTFFLPPDVRKQIDIQRQKYLQALKASPSITPLLEIPQSGKPPSKQGKRRVTVYRLQSSVRSEDGRQMIQINNRWFTQKNAPIHFEVDRHNPAIVHIQVGKKRFTVPVGATLVPEKNQVRWAPKIKIQPISKPPVP